MSCSYLYSSPAVWFRYLNTSRPVVPYGAPLALNSGRYQLHIPRHSNCGHWERFIALLAVSYFIANDTILTI